MAKKKSVERYYIDGVIQEAVFACLKIECILRIKSQLRRDIHEFNDSARYLGQVLSEAEHLEELSRPNFEEAALAAIAELPKE